jgi:excisionase family DNA binding protein
VPATLTPRLRSSRSRELPRHLTIAEVCDELCIGRSTFYDWRAKGRAPRCIKLPNGGLRIRRSELDRWLESREEVA